MEYKDDQPLMKPLLGLAFRNWHKCCYLPVAKFVLIKSNKRKPCANESSYFLY